MTFDIDGIEVVAGDAVRSKFTGVDYILVEEDGQLIGRDSLGRGRKIEEIQIMQCKKIDKPVMPKDVAEPPFDVIERLKAKAEAFDKRVKVHDSFIQHHSGPRSKTPKGELDRHEVKRDWYADARDQINETLSQLKENK